MKIGVQQLVAQAEEQIAAIDPQQAYGLLNDANCQIVDLRDIRELTRDGKIPGAYHAPRGMLEFWIDPDSPYHKPLFASGKRFIFYCSKGWRSALSTHTAQQMGLTPVCHIRGGFEAWKAADLPVEAVDAKN